MVSPDFTATRTFLPSLVSKRTRVGLPVLGSATATLLTCSGASLRSRPPCGRSEEHTSELQSLMRISYAVFCLTNKNIILRKSADYQRPHRATKQTSQLKT